MKINNQTDLTMRVFNMQRFRTERHLSQKQLADILKIPQSSISAMESGRTRVNQTYLNTLKNNFTFNVEDYMEEESTVFVKNVKGNNNGQNNGNGLDSEGMKSMERMMNRMLGNAERELSRYDSLMERYQALEAENRRLTIRVHELEILLLRNNIKY